MPKLINGICKFCNNSFSRKSRGYKNIPKFCSPKCAHTWQKLYFSRENSPLWRGKTIKPCKICGKSMELSKWQMKNSVRHNKIYCSIKCKNIGISLTMSGINGPQWKNGTSSRIIRNGIGFTRTYMKLIHQKNGNACLFCKSNKFLQIHHKDFDPKNNKPDNLTSVCINCHSTFHGLLKSYLARHNTINSSTRLA